MELKIYNSTGTLKLTASPNSTSTVTREVMGEYAVSAAFTHTDFVQLDVNDYVLVEGVKYKLKTPYKPVKKNTQTFIYQVKFYAPIHDAEDALFLYEADGDTTTEFSYDGGPREHLQLWVDNMNRIAGAVLWSIGTVIAGDNKTIDYRNVYCWEAAFGSNGIAATFETELWADGYVVNLCKASRGEIVELGYQKGLTQLQPEENGEMRFFTRLFPLGSTRNIDPTKYGASRLQLPSREKFVDRNVELYGIKEAWEEDAFKDIYPKYVGSVTSVRSEQLTNKEGREYTVYYFKDSGMTFNPNEYEIPEYTKMLAFQTGDLAGRGNEEGSFEANWHADTLEWEIINLYPDEETQLPGGVIIPQPGDTYIPWNFRMPDEYNTAAEEAYRQAVDNFLVSYSFDPTKYTAPTDRHYIERNAVLLFMVPADSDDITRDYEILLGELAAYNPELLDKHRILAVSKCDMLDDELLRDLKKTVPDDLPVVYISSVTGQGIGELKDVLWEAVNSEDNKVSTLTHHNLDPRFDDDECVEDEGEENYDEYDWDDDDKA